MDLGVEKILDVILAKFPSTIAVYRFGSWGTAHQNATSDLDIAVLLPRDSARTVDPWDWVQLSGELAVPARTERVDVVDLSAASTSLQAEILRTGDLAYSADEDARLRFEVQVVSKYHELNRWRKPLQEHYLSGSLGEPS